MKETSSRVPSRTSPPSPRALFAERLIVQGTKIGAVGVVAALLGTAQALGWVSLEPHHASEMGPPTLIGAAAMALFALGGLVLAPDTTRARLTPIAMRWLLGAIALACWGTWLSGR